MYMYFIRALMILSVWCTPPAFAQDEVSVLYTYGKGSFDQVLTKFTEQTNIKLKSEFKEQNDIKASMLTLMELGATPDVIIMPADHLGLHEYIDYSELDRRLFTAKISDRVWAGSYSDGKLYGAPLVQGNHLMLFYNKNLVREPAADWNAMLVQKQAFDANKIATIAWSFDEAYWFLPFLVGQGGWPINNGKIKLDTPAMAAALDFYKSLRTHQLPHPNCSYQCGVDMFKEGKMAYTINGDWIGKEFFGALGDNLGVTQIPMADGKKNISTFSTYVLATALMAPNATN
jgi:maltose-binding protein MalE